MRRKPRPVYVPGGTYFFFFGFLVSFFGLLSLATRSSLTYAIIPAYLRGAAYLSARRPRVCNEEFQRPQLLLAAHHDEVVSGLHCRFGRGIEMHLAVAAADGHHDHPEIASQLQFLHALGDHLAGFRHAD